MTTDDEPRVLLVPLALATALWLAAWFVDGPVAVDEREPGPARGDADRPPAPPASGG